MCYSLEVAQLKASSEKSSLLLATRTDRFVAYRARKEEEIKTLKARAERKIAALEKQHKFVLVRAEAERYRMERSHMKEVVSYKREIDSIQKAKEWVNIFSTCHFFESLTKNHTAVLKSMTY